MDAVGHGGRRTRALPARRRCARAQGVARARASSARLRATPGPRAPPPCAPPAPVTGRRARTRSRPRTGPHPWSGPAPTAASRASRCRRAGPRPPAGGRQGRSRFHATTRRPAIARGRRTAPGPPPGPAGAVRPGLPRPPGRGPRGTRADRVAAPVVRRAASFPLRSWRLRPVSAHPGYAPCERPAHEVHVVGRAPWKVTRA